MRRFFCLTLLAALQLAAEVRTLTILHTNDLHSRLSPLANHHGGFAYLASVIRQQREGCTDCIVLNAGDLAQGTPVSTIYKGAPVFEIANLLGFDAFALGNHDFDYGWQQTRRFIGMSKYPMISSNIVDAQNRLFTEKPWLILKVNGLRIGIIGAMTDNLRYLTTTSLMGEWHTTPVVETVRRYVAELRPQTDLIVVLAHIGPDEEKAFLAETNVPVIVSGHLHNGMEQAMTTPDHILVRVRGYGEQLGRLELKVDTEKKAVVSWAWKYVVVDNDTTKPAADVAALVKVWEDKVAEVVDHPLATSKRQLPKAEVRTLLEQAMIQASGADFAFMNSGGVRDILPAGQLLVRHVWNIMPFDNRVAWGVFKGRDLPEIVKKNHTLDPDKDYKLAVPDFVAENQSAPDTLNTKGLKFEHDSGLLRDALETLIRDRKVIE
jgi:2',3'-cyclic-nucleotide 2'-phosphodiesterase (5'-nucleotidase family)